MNVCAEFAALLDLYLDGELSREEMSAVADHLESCAGCRAYVDDGLAVRAAFPQAEEVSLPEGFAESVMEAVRQTSQTVPAAGKKAAGRRWIRFAVPLAACFAVVLALRMLPGPAGGSMENTILTSSPAGMDTCASGSDGPAASGSPGEGPSAPESAEEWKSSIGSVEAFAGAESSAGSYGGYYIQDAVNGEDKDAVPPQLEEGALDFPAEASQDFAAMSPGANRTEEDQEEFHVVIPGGQADLLAGYAPQRDGNGETVYRLTGGEYQVLAEALAERGVTTELPEEVPKIVLVYLE